MRFARLTAATALLAYTFVTSAGGGTALAVSSTDLVGPSGSGSFGGQFFTLSNGNFVIVDSDFDSAGTDDVGAVYFYNGANHALVTTLTGSTAGDSIGSDGIVELTNGNFVVISGDWDAAGAPEAGAVTWVSGTAGLSGVVSGSNSLVGATTNDRIGAGADEVVALPNGHYVVASPLWDDGGVANRGAVTWGNGAGGTVGAVSGANSIVGSQLNDNVGSGGVTPLTGGQYVVASPDWDFGATTNVGAATWAAGTGTTSAVVGGANSLIGVLANDHVADNGAVALANGHYVVESSQWQDIGANNAGAVTWGNGTTGTVGAVTVANSLVGTIANDQVGRVTPLPDGSYVVRSPGWDNGLLDDAGAVTLASPLGITGQVSAANSIVGNHVNDRLGSGGITVLSNGNYVISSPLWNGGRGAATFVAASSPTTGTVDAGNSLVGSLAGDDVSGDGVFALTNGNYVVASSGWQNAAIVNAGAVTWGNGSTGTAGAVTSANSLIGTTANDSAGSGGVTPMPNGSYVVSSPMWANGATPGAGAATLGAPTGGPFGPITLGNSLFGTATNDRVSSGGIFALPSGHYVVVSPDWNAGAVVNAGAATFATSLAPTVGALGADNSLIGSRANDAVGNGGVTVLPNGAYLVHSIDWDNGLIVDAGAVTFGGLNGARGLITLANSALGLSAGDIDDVGDRLTTEGAVLISRVGRNTVTLFITDITPPTFAVPPPNVTAVAAPGATATFVTYSTPVAVDNIGVPTVACTPPSGSLFAIGVTLVTCTATNTEGLTATASFTVTVATGKDYVPLAPARLADTRPNHVTTDGLFAGTGALAVGSVLELTVAGRGGVSANAVAATLNVTVTEAAAPGFVTAYPCGAGRPKASNLNFEAGATIPNAVISKIGDGGKVCIYASQPLHLVVDVNGEFPPMSSYLALNPARVLDTRTGQTTVDGQQQATGTAKAGTLTTVQITGRAGVPADATAVVLNVTVTEAAAAGYATVFPCGSQPPTASNLNYTRGSTIPNLVVAKIGAAGAVCIYTQSETHLVVDVNGFFPALTSYKALEPARLLDTRPARTTIDGQGIGAGAQPVGTVTAVHVAGRGGVPANATTAVLNVTVTEATANGYLTVYPCGIDPPLASNLNFVAAQTIPNAVVSKIGTGGNVCIYNSQPAQLIADVNGYFP